MFTISLNVLRRSVLTQVNIFVPLLMFSILVGLHHLRCVFGTTSITARPSSKSWASAGIGIMLRNIRNIRPDLYGKKTCYFCNRRKWKDFMKKTAYLNKMSVTSLLCGPWADLWPFYGLYCQRFQFSLLTLWLFRTWTTVKSYGTSNTKEMGASLLKGVFLNQCQLNFH